MRVAALFLLMLVFVSVLSLVTLIPSANFALVREKVAVAEQAIAAGTVDQAELDNLRLAIERLNLDISLLTKRQPSHTTIEHVISQLVSERTSNININQIFYVIREGVVHLDIRGVATDRKSLSEFSQLLESNEYFHQVEVPVENYIEANNLEYEIVLQVVSEFSL